MMAPPEAVRPAVGTFKQAERRVEARVAEESVETGVCKRVGKTCSKTCAVGDRPGAALARFFRAFEGYQAHEHNS